MLSLTMKSKKKTKKKKKKKKIHNIQERKWLFERTNAQSHNMYKYMLYWNIVYRYV